MLSSTQELDNLLEVLNQETILDMTFDQCIQKFNKHFSKPDWFKACSTLCYLIEASVSATALFYVSKTFANHLFFAFASDAVEALAHRRFLHPL